MVSDQGADAAVRQLADDALDIEHGQRIHARKRLIQEHEPRLGRERAGDLDAPPLPAREGQAESPAHVADAQLLQQLLEALLACGALQVRSEEHTSELQSQSNLVCRLLLGKKTN